MARILIADDNTAFRESLAETLTALGHETREAAGGEEALGILSRERIAAVFLDHRMPGMDGLQTLEAMNARLARVPPVIVLTAYANSGNTIEAMRLGAFDHLTKPVTRDAVIDVLRRALASEPLAMGVARAGESHGESEDELIGVSEAMREVHKRIGLAAASTVPVLISGETGTGKEMVARALHRHSSRADGPFVAINCAAIPADLLESELFGHVRGAFTGASADRSGCFRAADGGVLLLDEIGDMGVAVQAKILRVLQEREVTPLGGHRAVKVDVRVVAATHHHLATAVREGRFREDLFYRLNVLAIRIPPLRERLADIIPLAESFLRRTAGSGPAKAMTPSAAQALLRHSWPGNVRELRNLMERSHALVRSHTIQASDLGVDTAGGLPAELDARKGVPSVGDGLQPDWLALTLPVAVERIERLLITHALAQAGGNRADAARQLGIHRQLLYRKLAVYGLN